MVIPVPPSNPEIKITSALALATPAAMVPTPTSDKFTLILAFLLHFLNHKLIAQDLQLNRYHDAEVVILNHIWC